MDKTEVLINNNFKAGHVALIGRPNVGKSSIINALLKEKVVAVSHKPQTTRNAIRCIYTTENEQIVFIDTPGIHEPKHSLGKFMIQEATATLSQVDLICFVVEAGDHTIGAEEEVILNTLSSVRVPVLLIVNKVDKFTDTDYYKNTAVLYFEKLKITEAVPLSATKGFNLDVLTKTIAKYLPEQAAIYHEDMLMDTTERFLVAEIIREKILQYTNEEVPHGVAVIVEEFKNPEEYPELITAEIRATIIVDRAGQKGIIIGKGGSKLKEIGTAARKDLVKKFGYPIFLQLWVKVKPGWRKSSNELRKLGYSF